MDLTSTTLQAYEGYNAQQDQINAQARKERAKETSKYILYGASILVLFAIIMFSIKKLKNK